MKNPKFELGHLKTISEICSNLASWVMAMDKFYGVNLVIMPKKAKLAEAEAAYAAVSGKLRVK
jgi:Microtubule-binding stalk of dynein motor